jgi:hypothetical protein
MTGKLVSLFVIAAVVGFLGYMLYEHFKSSSMLNAGAATTAGGVPVAGSPLPSILAPYQGTPSNLVA